METINFDCLINHGTYKKLSVDIINFDCYFNHRLIIDSGCEIDHGRSSIIYY